MREIRYREYEVTIDNAINPTAPNLMPRLILQNARSHNYWLRFCELIVFQFINHIRLSRLRISKKVSADYRRNNAIIKCEHQVIRT